MSIARKFVGMATSELEYTTYRVYDDYSNYDEFISSNFGGWAYRPNDQYEGDFVKAVIDYVKSDFYDLLEKFRAELEYRDYKFEDNGFTEHEISCLIKEAKKLALDPTDLIREAQVYWHEMEDSEEEAA